MIQLLEWFLGRSYCCAPTADQFVGANLRAFRQKSGMTATAVGEVLSLPPSELGRIEAGKRQITASQLFLLARYFDTSVAAFFDLREGKA